MALFTLGYEKRTIGRFIELLHEAEVDVLIDVRDVPWYMCFDRDPRDCHRSILAARWKGRGRGLRVEHLGTDPDIV